MPTIDCIYCGTPTDKSLTELSRGAKYCSLPCYHDHHRKMADDAVAIGAKRCSRCKESKSISDFSPSKKHNDGAAGWCKRCKAQSETERRARPEAMARYRDQYDNNRAFRAASLVRAIQKRCRRERIPFALTPEWLTAKLEAGHCELTGIPFVFPVKNSLRADPYAPSVDRINPKNGYVPDNCRVVLFSVNLAISDWGLDVTLHICEALLSRHRREPAA